MLFPFRPMSMKRGREGTGAAAVEGGEPDREQGEDAGLRNGLQHKDLAARGVESAGVDAGDVGRGERARVAAGRENLEPLAVRRREAERDVQRAAIVDRVRCDLVVFRCAGAVEFDQGFRVLLQRQRAGLLGRARPLGAPLSVEPGLSRLRYRGKAGAPNWPWRKRDRGPTPMTRIQKVGRGPPAPPRTQGGERVKSPRRGLYRQPGSHTTERPA